MDYPVESFSPAERAALEPHFTNLDRPVFALVNLPETVKGALFARYSRYAGTLRRLFLDEFADSLPEVPVVELAEGERDQDGSGHRCSWRGSGVFLLTELVIQEYQIRIPVAASRSRRGAR